MWDVSIVKRGVMEDGGYYQQISNKVVKVRELEEERVSGEEKKKGICTVGGGRRAKILNFYELVCFCRLKILEILETLGLAML